MSGHLVVVTGLPGSGKTTVATALVAAGGGVRLCPDDWMTQLGASLWDERLRERVETLQWRLGRSLLSEGGTVVVEWGTWARIERDRLRREAAELGATTELVVLDPPLGELWRRLETRAREDPPMTRDRLAAYARSFEVPTDEERDTYDTVAPGAAATARGPRVRPAGFDDIDAVLALWAVAGENESRPVDTPDAVRALVAHDPAALLVVEQDGDLIGSVIAGWDGWRASLYRLAVHPAHRGRGAASLLLRAAHDRLARLGAVRFDAMVLDANQLGQRTWAGEGYVRQLDWSRWVRPVD